MKKKVLASGFVLLCSALLLGGCKFKKVPDVSNIGFGNQDDPLTSVLGDEIDDLDSVEKMSNILVELGPEFDGDAILQYFYGQGLEEFQDDDEAEMSLRGEINDYRGFECEKDAQRVTLLRDLNGRQSTFEYSYLDERAGRRYENVSMSSYRREVFTNRLMEFYEKGELETCSVQEALEACAPLAKACGYENAQTDVYVMTQEAMNTMGEKALGVSDYVYSAPNPDYDYYETLKLAEEKLKQSQEAREAGNDELADQLRNEYGQLMVGMDEPDIEWTEEMEAYLIVYRSVLNGLLLDSAKHYMICIYVPHYEQVVYANADHSLVLTGVQEEQELISRREALQEVLRIVGMSDGKGITVTNMSLVYSPRSQDYSNENKEKVVHPCWRVDYCFSDEILENNPDLWHSDYRTVLIDAVEGIEMHYYDTY